jgi:membrane associated rhomboid family serine protease
MFPISDDNPRRHLTPYLNWSLVAICVVAFLYQVGLGLGTESELRTVYSLGMIPARVFGYDELPPDLIVVPAWATIFTSAFLHGGWLHLGGNMLYLWIFGDNIEDSMGHVRYLVFYFVCAAAAAFAQGFAAPTSEIPMIGASGAISGVLGAYILLHPSATIRVFIFLGFFFTIAHIPAWIVLGVWFLLQLFNAAASSASEPGTAFWAHIGGFVAGALLVSFFRRRDVPLMEPPRSKPFQIERRRGPWG